MISAKCRGAISSLDSYLDGRERGRKGQSRVGWWRVKTSQRGKKGKERGLTLLALPYTYGSTFSPSRLYWITLAVSRKEGTKKKKKKGVEGGGIQSQGPLNISWFNYECMSVIGMLSEGGGNSMSIAISFSLYSFPSFISPSQLAPILLSIPFPSNHPSSPCISLSNSVCGDKKGEGGNDRQSTDKDISHTARHSSICMHTNTILFSFFMNIFPPPDHTSNTNYNQWDLHQPPSPSSLIPLQPHLTSAQVTLSSSFPSLTIRTCHL